ncbi:hypothetical protein [Marinoscillum furvescens]|uniref:Uncharacterized protein n=1 Tax=Marinoscillum furvescens DSM 4134 TaxID=1122208 RepID=A0A3D9L8U9_MARFU|nr:hypothetical protein [Marinoscillum furvescens]REE02096.1 hypothetical protein C7460_102116 [Marinoscillum furvescens DSM 4134]
MKPATISEIKRELALKSTEELRELCLRLAKFKKENKELLTYLLYEAGDEAGYVRMVKLDIEEDFADINTTSYYFIKKSIRKILRNTKKYIRYSQRKDTEVELLLYFCEQMKAFSPSINRSTVLKNLYIRQLQAIEKLLKKLPEDLQHDFGLELERLKE